MRKSQGGIFTVELTGADLGKTLSLINKAGIELFHIQHLSELTCRFSFPGRLCVKLEKICQRQGDSLKILKIRGFSMLFLHLRKRQILLLGLTLWFVLILFLPTRVLFVCVQGNDQVPDAKILSAADGVGIGFGASRREVRSEKVKNALLAEVPQLQWTGINTSGCLAVISVRERAVQEDQQEDSVFSNIVATRDGFIVAGDVTQGTGMFQVGQTVKEGQVLISGYTDCGICIQTTRSQGEVIAETNRAISVVAPDSYLLRREATGRKKKISLLLGKNRINLWKDSGISDATCGRMYKEYYITLPGGFCLPIALCVDTYTGYDTESVKVLQEDVETDIMEFAEELLRTQMVAGEILQQNFCVTTYNGTILLQGSAVCREMIGRELKGQIGDTNGKNS